MVIFISVLPIAMQKITLTLIVVAWIAGLLFCGCGGKGGADALVLADSLIDRQPDSAMRMLDRLGRTERLAGGRLHYYDLLQISVRAKQMLPVSDSLVRATARYYRHRNDSLKRARACLYLSRRILKKDSVREALDVLLEACRFLPAGETKYTGLACYDLGEYYAREYETEEAIRCYLQALPRFLQVGTPRNMILLLSRLGWAHLMCKRFDEALAYFRSSCRVALTSGDSPVMPYVYNDLASAFRWLGRFDSSEYYLRRTAASRDEEGIVDRGMYRTRSDLCLLRGQIDSARTYILKVEEWSRNEKDTARIAGALFSRCEIEKKAGNHELALRLYKEGNEFLSAIVERNHRNSVDGIVQKYVYELLADDQDRLAARQRNLRLAVSLLAVVLLSGLLFHRISVRRRDRRLTEAREREHLQQDENRRIARELRRRTVEHEQAERRMRALRVKMDEAKSLLLAHLDMKRRISLLSKSCAEGVAPDMRRVGKMVDELAFTPDSWPEIEQIVGQLYDDLQQKLFGRYSHLTVDDIRLCCMIVIGLESPEIALVLDINTDSVYRKRRRLKKKIGLGEKQSLRDHLQCFVSGA